MRVAAEPSIREARRQQELHGVRTRSATVSLAEPSWSATAVRLSLWRLLLYEKGWNVDAIEFRLEMFEQKRQRRRFRRCGGGEPCAVASAVDRRRAQR